MAFTKKEKNIVKMAPLASSKKKPKIDFCPAQPKPQKSTFGLFSGGVGVLLHPPEEAKRLKVGQKILGKSCIWDLGKSRLKFWVKFNYHFWVIEVFPLKQRFNFYTDCAS